MSELCKAQLQEVSADANESPIGKPVPVQFNPSTLKLRLSNQVEGGESRGRQRRQQTGASSTVLSMELVFDSADEGSEAAPVSVRTKTAIVEKYVVPKTDGSEVPPRLRFQWNNFFLTGIVDGLDIEFDLFAANGTPLRARVSLSIKEQDPKYQYLAAGSGARGSGRAKPPGAPDLTQPGAGGAGPGVTGGPGASVGFGAAAGFGAGAGLSASLSAGTSVGIALEGETGVEFATRMGLDPGAWRGLSTDLQSGLSLNAGAAVGFDARMSLAGGLGTKVGVQADAKVSLSAAIGVNGAGGASEPTAHSTRAKPGFALSTAGGVQAAIERVSMGQSKTAAEQTRQAFSTSASTASLAFDANMSTRQRQHPPLLTSGISSAESAQLPGSQSQLDLRAISYGLGVPLQPLYPTVRVQQQPVIYRGGSDQAPGKTVFPPVAEHPAVSPWQALPHRDPGRKKADQLSQSRQSVCFNNSCGGSHP